ncbi:MAG: ATP-dependent helicase [Verrucomicrobia bacterium]|nr:MAG: ATP-dependent helicase [Verrucomicrobiota bacterium]
MDYALEPGRPPTDFPPIDFRGELNDEQYAAVTAEPGPMLVLAGAGSGKTRTLTYRVAWLLSQGVHPAEILLLTFTNKAAKEMLHRVEDLTGFGSGRFWGGTFHHIGHRLLRMHGEVIDIDGRFTILDSGEAESFLRDATETVDRSFFRDKTHPKPKPLSNILSMSRNTCLGFSETVLRYFPQHDHIIERLPSIAEVYSKAKRKHQVVDYDDLLVYWLELIEKAPEIAEIYQKRFRHTLVDEYQDTNILQARIIDNMAPSHQIMAVGDDAQCIYSWRGANFENIITFPDRHTGTRIFRIETNYRSTPEILTLANSVLRNHLSGQGFEKELRPARPSNIRPFVVQSMDTREQAVFVVSRLRGLIDEGRSPSEIAVLYRAHFHAIDLQVELSRESIPFQITSGVRFFEQAHVRDLIAHLRFVYNPQDVVAFTRLAVLLPRIGDKGARKLYDRAVNIARKEEKNLLDVLRSPAIVDRVPKDAKPDWTPLIDTLIDMREAARDSTPAEVVQLGTEGWYQMYMQGAYANYLSRSDDLRSLIGFAERYQDLQELLAQVALLNSEVSDRSVDDDDEAIRLTTIHQAKGLEFEVVFVIGLADGMFPLRRAIEGGDLDEERRLFYVSVTRAKDELYLCHPRVSMKGGPVMSMPPSRFLEELPSDTYETLRLRRNPGW